MGCLSKSHSLRVVEAVLCALALLIPMIRKQAIHPYSVWCEFAWVFCLIVAVVILVVEKLKLDLLLTLCLQNSWGDLATGLTLLCALMVLSASVIYSARLLTCTCFLEILCAIISFVATLVFLVDGVMAKIKSPGKGYLSAVCGVLRFTEAFLACMLIAAFASYFLGVSPTQIPPAMGWCMLVYVVCFAVTVLMILFNLVKLLKALLCVDKIEVLVNIVAVLLYLSAIILWPIYGKRHYSSAFKFDSDQRTTSNYGYRYRDLMAVTALTAINLLLYIVDLILSVLALNQRI